MAGPVQVTVSPGGRQFVVDAGDLVRNRRGLNAVLADRLAEELQEYFRRDNTRKPNRLGGVRTNFYNQIADATAVAEITEDGATVAIADARFRIHLFGGEIKPVKAKALTIPLVKEAHGLRVSSYVRKFGRRLFTIPGRHALFEKTDAGGESLASDTTGTSRDAGGRASVGLAARTQIRPVYALARSVKIDADPTALPDRATLARILQEEAQDFIDRQIRKPGGGLA